MIAALRAKIREQTGAPLKPAFGLSGGFPVVTVQYATFEDLRQYCYRVASVVGLVCIHVFGYRNPEAEPLAENCGLAFQLTNIIRDVKEDAAAGRVYLPQQDLAQFNLSTQDVLTAPDPARFRPLLALEADRAREFYASGDALIPYVSEDSQPALWVLVTIYRRLLEKIAQNQYDVFTAKVSLTAHDGRVLYRNDSILYREQYQSTQDLSGFIQEDGYAVKRVARDFAQAIVSDMLESF